MTDANYTPDDIARGLANAPPAPGDAPAKPDAALPPKDPGNGKPPRGTIRDTSGQPLRDHPVTALGQRGDLACFLDANGQLREVKRLDLQALQSLYAGNMPALCAAFPKWRKGEDAPVRVPGQFEQATASPALWAACGEAGVFNPSNTVRGVGAWTDDDGGLIYHLGDRVLWGGEVLAPGRIDGRIYPAAAPIPAPIDGGPDPVPPLLDTIQTWNWAQPDLHPFVALGMICAQMMGGALRWRPVSWLTAPAGAGKSSFQELLQLLHGDGLIQSADATKAGITSRLGHSSLPVALDELEPEDERSRRVSDIITLARLAASGADWSRGSADQTAVGGKMFSAFLFSSILIPGAMSTADVQRLIRLDMHRLTTGAGLSLDPRTWRKRGARLKGLLIRRWPSLRERVVRYRHALEAQGVTGRNADNWEILLALADMAHSADLPDDSTCSAWARKVALAVAADKEEVTNDADAMLAHMLGQPLDPFRRGEQYTVAQWLMVAAGLPGAPPDLCRVDYDGPAAKDERKAKANDQLAQYGLRIYHEAEPVLFVANTGPARQRALFEGTAWNGGAWSQSARRVPLAYATKSTKTLAGARTRGTMIPLQSIPALAAFPEHPPVSSARPAVTGDDLEDFQ